MSDFTRRDFLGVAAAAGAFPWSTAWAAASRARQLVGGSQSPTVTGNGWMVIGHETDSKLEHFGRRQHLLAIDLDTTATHFIPLATGCMPHGIISRPGLPHRVMCMPQFGGVACEVDLKEMRVVRDVRTERAWSFYGHGAYSADGKILYTAEAQKAVAAHGRITIRDAETLKPQGQLDSHGLGPHDCRILPDGTTMVIANAGLIQVEGTDSKPMYGDAKSKRIDTAVCYVDLRDGRLLHKTTTQVPEIHGGHLDIAADGTLVVACSPADKKSRGPLLIGGPDKELVPFGEGDPIQKRMQGQALSVRICEATGIVGVTTPTSNLLTFWDLKTRKLSTVFDLFKPRGLAITPDQKLFMTNAGDTPIFIDTQTLQIRTDVYASLGITGNGSHLQSISGPSA